ncbi:MAG: alpha/beta hydrolase fold domain-containing protein, partial [Myxococcota bacterium]|nr:alpha/beta hydrolase fold domain-containing protein [Myxococcota bacterium]
PSAEGPYAVERSSAAIEGGTAVAFVPMLPAGARGPLVILKHGFQLATANYATTAAHIASHGFVVIGVDTGGGAFGGPTNADERDASIAAIDWALSSAPFAARVDPERIAVMGHSRGGKVAVMIAAADARVGAALLLDPVNGCGPGASYSADCPDVTSDALAGALTIPVGVMGETNSATGGFMPCAPAEQNYQTIYDALDRSSWAVAWTFTGADHMDFTDDGGGFAGSFCADGPGDDAMIRAQVRALAVAFLRRHLGGELAMDPWLTGAMVPADVTREGP